MDERDFSNLGRKIEERVNDAVHAQTVSDLIHVIDMTVGEVKQTVTNRQWFRMESSTRPGMGGPDWFENNKIPRKEPRQAPNGERGSGDPFANERNSGSPFSAQEHQPASQPGYVPGAVRRPAQEPLVKRKSTAGFVVMVVFGYIFSIACGLSVLFELPELFWDGGVVTGDFFTSLILFLIGLCLLFFGYRFLHYRKRCNLYLKHMQGRAFCGIKQLSEAARCNQQQTIKDLKKMLKKGEYPNAYLDEEETCLMIGEEMHELYLKAKVSQKERERREAEREEQRRKDPNAAKVQAAVEEGDNFLRKIRSANDAIVEEAISRKLDRLETVTAKIFDFVEKRPQKLPEIRRFMNYYLPTTLKLVEAYRDFEMQPVQGDNILAAKQEIRDALDTINTAFENLLDDLFEEQTFDISSDISALEAMLAQEGLTGGDDFKAKKG